MNIKAFAYNGQTITQREDGYINLTQMCQANGKRLSDFLKHPRTLKCIFVYYSLQTGLIKHAIESDNNGETWGCFELASELAYQSNANFSVWFVRQMYDLSKPIKQGSFSNYQDWKNTYFPWDNDKSNNKEKEGVVYFILNKTRNLVKIGFTQNDSATRLSAFQSGAVGETLYLLGEVKGTIALEKCYHSYLKEYQYKGEWFKYTDFVQTFIEKTMHDY